MKITIVMGFFLPMPPVAGGAVEKSWHRLAREFVQRGHEITLISRQWHDWPKDEVIAGVRYLRVPGFNHRRKLWHNLLLDFIWSLRVHRQLPDADIVALNTISLPCWLGTLHPLAGKVVVMPGRMPKGQFHFYRRPARILVPSNPVHDAVVAERPAFRSLIRTVGYPIDWSALASASQQNGNGVTIGYIGRINREKGLDLLMGAFRRLGLMELPPWRAIICGPSDIARGGSGQSYLHSLQHNAPPQTEFLEPIYDEPGLRKLYQQFDVFCYPSLSAQGETFGVSVAEAMAAGALPVVSALECFRDFVIPGETGLTFDATAPNAEEHLARNLADLIQDRVKCAEMGRKARLAVRQYDFGLYADRLLADFEQLTAAPEKASSAT
ncbi:MAG: glycosyltransferase family 4 protein [Cephaloticoccus sp.]|nr:glycosyltransferase family 4 protein [Cephaloticoccus sp.]MCF7759441.1 glycosyltransferase family 4 protein [Cephaloticoccus sp.]